ncbi:MAG: DUF4301 family protein, partial [Nitrospira sp.]|nr:DUF4301 family protein [Nitrospira sp.]
MLTPEDHLELIRRGLSTFQVESQLQRLRHGVPPITIIRPCRLNDGIVQLRPENFSQYQRQFDTAWQTDRVSKFIPASGAATRMFNDLLKFLSEEASPESPSSQAPTLPHAVDQAWTRLLDFPFIPDLEKYLHGQGQAPPTDQHAHDLNTILQAVLKTPGLGYAELPKALLSFHRYEEGPRTSLEEHIHEAIRYHPNPVNPIKIHLTVSPQFEQAIRNHLQTIQQTLQKQGWKLDCTVSFQKPSTDTVALDSDNQLFRDDDGKLVFRPGGHGALLENLNDYQGDIVFISNIDNVVPDHLKDPIISWRKALGGYLVELQQQVFQHIEQLSSVPVDAKRVQQAEACIQQELLLPLPQSYRELALPDQATLLKQYLDRPIRVCGVVPNTGDPGGGPFWVAHPEDAPSRQIVEQSQVNPDSEAQQKLFASGTHFNPVDLVCGVRDFQGNPFNLLEFVDPGTGFIGMKS